MATGDVDLRNWPQQSYQFKSHVQFARMRQLFFKDEKWELSGEGDFAGRFQLFKGGPGRDLSGTFSSALFGVNDYRFSSLYGGLHWTRDALDIHDAGAKLFGGDGRFSYTIRPLGTKAPPTARLRDELPGRRSRGRHRLPAIEGPSLRRERRAASDVVLEWPLGKFSEHRGGGRLAVEPPPGVQPMTASLGRGRRRRRRSRVCTNGDRLRRRRCRRICRLPAI